MLQRFLASEFGHDVDRADPVEPGLTMYKEKRLVRRVVEQSGVPYTNICCNSIASWPYYDNCHPSQLPPPLDQLQIYGHGNVKGIIITKQNQSLLFHTFFIEQIALNCDHFFFFHLCSLLC